jgi:small-conductance mechanosensitive channel
MESISMRCNLFAARWLLSVSLVLSLGLPSVQAQDSALAPPAPSTIVTAPTVPQTMLQPAALPQDSAAAQAMRLEAAILEDEQRVTRLRGILVNPEGEYAKAEASFKSSEVWIKQLENGIELARDEATKQNGSRALEDFRKIHTLARERFDLAIETRKKLQVHLATIEEKTRDNRVALTALTGKLPTITVAAAIPPVAGPVTEQITAPATTTPAATVPAVAAPAAPVPAPAPAPAPPAPVVAAPLVAPVASSPETIAAALSASKPASKELLKAEQEAKQRQAEVQFAEHQIETVADRLATLDKDLELETELLASARKKVEIAEQTGALLQQTIQKATAGAASPELLGELNERFIDAENMLNRGRNESAKRAERLGKLQTQRADLSRAEVAAQKHLEDKTALAEQAEEAVSKLKNPFSPHNMLEWAIQHGPKIGVILIVMLLLRAFVSIFSRRVVSLMVKRSARGTTQEREDRATTLLGVFHNAMSITIIVGGTLMICEEVGVAAGPLMGGAAVLGLAIAFGAQNLIRDYFHGFVILLENQYKLNDVLKIGDISGQVEQITLRMTVLRDVEGNVHFIPNGKIDSVTNMTHGWSRAVLDVAISYDEDPDRALDVLAQVCEELRHDTKYSDLILEPAEILGVESLGDSAVMLKFFVKTRPTSKSKVKRELLRRIKLRFQQEQILTPTKNKTVHHVNLLPADQRTLAERASATQKRAG